MKTQKGRKINTQVSAERRGGLLHAIFVEFLGLAADSSRFRSDFCAVPCGRGYLPRFAGRGGRVPKLAGQGGDVHRNFPARAFLTYRGRIDFGRIRYRGKRIDCAVRRIVRNARRIKSKLHFFSDIGVALCGFACCVSSFPKKIRPTCRGNSGKIKNVQHVPQRARPEGYEPGWVAGICASCGGRLSGSYVGNENSSRLLQGTSNFALPSLLSTRTATAAGTPPCSFTMSMHS